MKFFIKAFGCQYNEWDAARLSFALRNLGLIESDQKDADVAILLNCSVRKTGVDRTIGLAKNLDLAGKKIFVAGCILKEDRQKFIDKNAVIWDSSNIKELAKYLAIPDQKDKLFDLLEEGQKNSNYIPIMKGCNNFCAYCAVPYTRGRETSRPIEDILAAVKKTLEAGHSEIWLLGQNVNSYKDPSDLSSRTIASPPEGGSSKARDPLAHEITYSIQNNYPKTIEQSNNFKTDFAILLDQINAIPGNFKVYFTSNHPKDMSDDIIEAVAKLPKIAKLIHLPIQSGSNKILKAMNRPYTKKQYLALVDKMKKKIPGLRLTTDVIVGFPGETEADFQETVAIFEKVGYFQSFNNKYSPRQGTAAWKLGDPISWEEKQRRWHILNKIANANLPKKSSGDFRI